MMFSVSWRWTLLTAARCLSLPLHAQVTPTLGDQELQRQQQRERARTNQADERPDVRLLSGAVKSDAGYPASETPCSPIHQVILQGASAHAYTWALTEADSSIGRCLGSGLAKWRLARGSIKIIAGNTKVHSAS